MAEQDKKEITALDVKRFLEEGNAVISTSEFNEFWKSLSDEEKQDFKAQIPPKALGDIRPPRKV